MSGFCTPAAKAATKQHTHGFMKQENQIKGRSAILSFLDTYLKEGSNSTNNWR
ncbi:hypothetical protein [Pontibacter actiniarum]|uniref:hypothetical protein n=1 Tax=Pontibacter actiniarum TaxID=323450 RepID=UPI000427BE35|nr:hypothetical protein [Pontibacter actiniarum]